MTDLLIAAARAWYEAGYCVVPAHSDGSKRPWGSWEKYQQERLPLDELEALLATGKFDAIGVICGHVSGNVEMIELEALAANREAMGFLRDIAARNGLSALLDRLTEGCAELTPTFGTHYFARCSDRPVAGNMKLAREQDRDTGEVRVLAETRGEGGFVIVAPSPGRKGHPDGRHYIQAPGTTPAGTPEFTGEEIDQLHWLFGHLDEMPAAAAPQAHHAPPPTADDTLTSWDDWAAQTTWDDLLTPQGWTLMHNGQRNGHPNDTWCRPGKNPADGPSATTAGEDGPMYVFSSSTTLPTEVGLSKFAVYSHYHHGGDMEAAARHLYRAGYGDRLMPSADIQPWNPDITTTHQHEQSTIDPAQQRHMRLVDAELARMRAQHDAKAIHNAEQRENTWREPPSHHSLTAELAIPDEPVSWAITDIMPTGSNTLLTAQYKTGKTTLTLNMIRAMADNQLFLGRYTPTPLEPGRTVAWFNYEVDDRQARRWLRDLNIKNTDSVVVLNLRGYRLTLTDTATQAWVIRWLRDHNVHHWVMDPFARAFTGSGDENSNSEVGVWLDIVDSIKEQSGIDTLTLPTHTGRLAQVVGAERARGATRLDDWADIRWLLTKDDNDRRFIRFEGRDVDVEEEELTWEADTRTVLLTGRGGRKKVKTADIQDVVWEFVRDNPGCSGKKVREGVSKGSGQDRTNALNSLMDAGRVRREGGPSGYQFWVIPPLQPFQGV